MADTSGLPDVSKANFYDQPPEEQQKLLDALKMGQDALQQRYANPNWFNVAAGFFKPQLGGFAASLGSASQALGDWTEKQRENEIPIAEMRARVGMMQNQMTQNQAANSLLAKQAAGAPMTAALLQQMVARAPDAPATKAAQAMYTAAQAERGLAHSEFADAMARVQYQRTLPGGGNPDPADVAIISKRSNTQPPAAGPRAPAPASVTAPVPEDSHVRFSADNPDEIASLVMGIADLKDPKERVAAMAQFKAQSAQGTLGQGSPAAATPGPVAPAPNPLSLDQQIAQNKLNSDELQAANAPHLASILGHSQQKFQDNVSLLKATSKLVNDPEVAAGLGVLYADPGAWAAIKKAAAEGVQLSASGGILGGSISASLPVESILRSSKLAKPVQEKVRQVMLNLSQLEAQNIRDSISGVGAGGHANVPEFTTAMSRVVTGSDPQSVLRPYLARETVKNMRTHAHNLSFHTWRDNNPGVPNAKYIGSIPYGAIVDKYAPDIDAAYGGQ